MCWSIITSNVSRSLSSFLPVCPVTSHHVLRCPWNDENYTGSRDGASGVKLLIPWLSVANCWPLSAVAVYLWPLGLVQSHSLPSDQFCTDRRVDQFVSLVSKRCAWKLTRGLTGSRSIGNTYYRCTYRYHSQVDGKDNHRVIRSRWAFSFQHHVIVANDHSYIGWNCGSVNCCSRRYCVVVENIILWSVRVMISSTYLEWIFWSYTLKCAV